MFLSLVRNSFLVLIITINLVNAEIYESSGNYFLTPNISEDECYERAKYNAFKKIMQNAGLERIQHYENLNCKEIKDKSTCEYYQESQVYFEGGFLTSKNTIKRELINEDSKIKICNVTMEANVEEFSSKHDPNFILEAKLNKRIFRNGEEIIISGETNFSSYVYLFFLDQNKEEYITIFPNSFEINHLINGNFQIPSLASSNNYILEARFPVDHNVDMFQEYLVILSTKSDFKVIERESSYSFFKRLNDFGRENWKQKKLGYFIIKEQ